MSAFATGSHEGIIGHLGAASVAAAQMGVSKDVYERLTFAISITADEGEFALLPCDSLPEDLHEQIMALSALGPVAQHDDPVAVLRSKDAQAIIAAGSLSDEDVALAAKFSGPETTPAITLLAVKRLGERLGEARIIQMTQLLRTVANQQLDMQLCDFVPYSAAQGAVRAAKSRFDKLTDVKFDGWGVRA